MCFMMTKLQPLFVGLALIASVHQAIGQGTKFFRISGPAATTITAFEPDGIMVWSNAQPGSTYTVQTAASLAGGTNWVDYVQLPTSNSVNTNQIIDFNPPTGMALVPAGSFVMGDTLDGDPNSIPTNVMVSAFYMDTNLVSYGQWLSVYNWATNNGYEFVVPGAGNDLNQPAWLLDWDDAVKWCNARSQQAGLTPVYYIDSGLMQVYSNQQANAVYANWTAPGYRLPTEAEWEKAARGGLNQKRFPWGDTISETQANYDGDTYFPYDFGPNGYNPAFVGGPYPYTNPGGYFPPNGYGLNDMAGNEEEWVWDWYQVPYAGGVDPRGPISGPNHITRGGSFSRTADIARCEFRWQRSGDTIGVGIGFRCVKVH